MSESSLLEWECTIYNIVYILGNSRQLDSSIIRRVFRTVPDVDYHKPIDSWVRINNSGGSIIFQYVSTTIYILHHKCHLYSANIGKSGDIYNIPLIIRQFQ